MNAKMPELKAAFEAAGFTDVKTVRSSGNVVFTATGIDDGSVVDVELGGEIARARETVTSARRSRLNAPQQPGTKRLDDHFTRAKF